MAKKKQEDPPKGAPAWMNTFSDLMNLLLCFFVLLFSMSTVDTDKLEAGCCITAERHQHSSDRRHKHWRGRDDFCRCPPAGISGFLLQ